MLNSAYSLAVALQATSLNPVRKSITLNLKLFFFSRVNEISKRKANWIGHILCRNCLLKRVIEGKIKSGIEVTGRRRRRRRKLLDDFMERKGYLI